MIALLCWAALVSMCLYLRPLIPLDETRYVSVAWEMWQRNDFLVPFLNGAPYSHKPPLFFWLIQAGWWVFGVNELTPRLTAPLFGLINLFMVSAVARKLWPDTKGPALTSPLILLSFLLWTVFTTTTMFDMLLTFFVLLGVWSILHVKDGHKVKGWLLLGLAIGGGLLTKGPVVLLYLLPLLLLVPYWSCATFVECRRCWILGSCLATAIGVGIALCWALPAASAGGEDYAQAILWSQTTGRVSKAFSHQRPVWWYLPLVPLVLFPWTLISQVWAGLKKQLSDPGSRFCISWVLPQLLILSLISSKQLHYLLPLLPATALLFARSLDLSPNLPHRYKPIAIAASFLFLGTVILILPLFSSHLVLPENAFTQNTVLFWPVILLCVGILLMLRAPSSWPVLIRNLSLAMVILVITLHLSIMNQARTYYDFSPMAQEISRLQEQGVPIAHMGKYHDQFHFLGRLKKPLKLVSDVRELKSWGAENPNGVVVYYQKNSQFPEQLALFAQGFRLSKRMGLFRVDELLSLPNNQNLARDNGPSPD